MQAIWQTHRPPLPRSLSTYLPRALLDEISHRGIPCPEEIRLHADRITTVHAEGVRLPLCYIPSSAELQELLHRMCGGSLYAHAQSICQGYVTLAGGVRVGICGKAAIQYGEVIGVGAITGLVIRIPHRVRVDVSSLTELLLCQDSCKGILLYGPPGVGKTTALRAIAESAASPPHLRRTVAVDTREELCFGLEGSGLSLNILLGYPRARGIEIAVRSLGAELIITDEIAGPHDGAAILAAANCGVPIVASAHADAISELLLRPDLHELHRARVFSHYVRLTRANGTTSFAVTSANADLP